MATNPNNQPQRMTNEDKLIFIHVPKTAGRSMARALMVPPDHTPLAERLDKDSHHIAAGAKIATLIRNPWSRAVSCFCHFGLFQKYKTVNIIDGFRLWAGQGFPHDWQLARCPRARLLHQEDWIESTRPLDYIGHYEDLEGSLRDMAALAGIEVLPLPHLNKRRFERPEWRDFWTPELVNKSMKAFGDFAERYGYEKP